MLDAPWDRAAANGLYVHRVPRNVFRRALLCGIAGILFAGCLDAQGELGAPTASTTPSSDAAYQSALASIRSLLEPVPCEAPYSATATTANFLRLQLAGFEGGGPQEIDIRGHLLLAARAGGFTTVDITDPQHPEVLAEYGEAGGQLDVKFSPDNLTAIVSSYQNIDLVDVRNPDTLVRVGRWKFTDAPSPPAGLPGQNAHMVYTARIRDQDWVFLATQSSTGAWILKLEGPPEARKLTYVTRTAPVQGGLSGTHDLFVQYDQDLKKWVLYAADAFLGWAAYDVSNPTSPTFITAVPNGDVSGTHSVQAAKIGNRRIVATSTEFGMNALKIWDATRLEAPVLIGYWTQSVGPGILEIQHNLNIVDGRLYMAHYTFGLFVFDLTKLPPTSAGALELKPIAHYAGSGAGGGTGFWDVVLHDGLLYSGVYSGAKEQGLHVIGYGCLAPGDSRLTSVG